MNRIQIAKTPECVGQKIEVAGWVESVRDHSKLIFWDLRDKSGRLQVVLTGELTNFATLKEVKEESVVIIAGSVQKRPEKLVNDKLVTGTVELLAHRVEVVSQSATLPLKIGDRQVNEERRLQYRYLDLRSDDLRANLTLRHRFNLFFRNYLDNLGFLEIETPILSKSTPEGARDFLVPSRKAPGQFFALPQSPQQYKQLLMVAGMERYFQLARCFRDEDQRGQRQPEFTQLDIEMSFAGQEEVINLVEEMLLAAISKITPQKQISTKPFIRLTHAEALQKYGTDRPDLRQNKDDPKELAFCWVTDFPMFEYKEGDKRWGAEHNPFTMPKEEHHSIITQVAAGKLPPTALGEVLALQYDLSLNGNEIFGGAVRNHNPSLLADVFAALGHSREEINSQFGHLLTAFSYGVPPHAGIASGHDRLVMVLANEPNIREVIAFPKNGEAFDPLMSSPSSVSDEQLRDLGLTLRKNDEQKKASI